MRNTNKLGKYKTLTCEITYYSVDNSSWVVKVERNALKIQTVVILTWSEYESDLQKIKNFERNKLLEGAPA